MTEAPLPLAAVLEQCRAHRAALVRQVTLPPDSLHRVLRCARCNAWNIDTRVYEGSLQLAEGGARPCVDLAELCAIVSVQHRALHKTDRLDGCHCGAPSVSLVLTAARFFHAMSGAGAELLLELFYEREQVSRLRIGRAPHDGAVTFIDAPNDAAVRALFGVPLTLWPAWHALVDATDGAIVSVEEGLALAAFHAGAGALQRELDEALASDPELRAYGLSPRVASDPAWHWLRAHPSLAARPDTTLLMLLRHDVLAARLGLLAASRGLGTRREGDTVWIEDGLPRWPVELPIVAEEGLRRGFSLSAMAAASLTHAVLRTETVRSFIDAIEGLRAGVTFTVQGMQLTPTREGTRGRAIDLRIAPFGATPDPETLERDLRFYLQESPAWSDPWRVCPCGAARVVAVHRWPREALSEVAAEHNELLRLDDAPDDADTVRLLGLSCDRHVEYGLRTLLASHPRALPLLHDDAARDRDRLRFVVRVAPQRDEAGRVAALVEASNLLDATTAPELIAGLVCATLGAPRDAQVTTLSRALAVVAERDTDPALVSKLTEAGALLWTITHGAPPLAAVSVHDCDATTRTAGHFVRLDEAPIATSKKV